MSITPSKFEARGIYEGRTKSGKKEREYHRRIVKRLDEKIVALKHAGFDVWRDSIIRLEIIRDLHKEKE